MQRLYVIVVLGLALSGCATGTKNNTAIDKESIRKEVQRINPDMKACYEKALKTAGKKLEGKMVLQWKINDQGKAFDTLVKSDTVGSQDLQTCAVKVINAGDFPKAPAGVTADIVAYPFIFSENKPAHIQD